jgi:hypothetical protein
MSLLDALLGLMTAVAVPALAGAVVGLTLRGIKDQLKH